MKKHELEISVVMAVRNAEPTLEKSLQSICNQSFPAKEIILILNGCQDKSAEIAQGFSEKDSRIHILESSESGGVAQAAQLGCRKATCPLIARMDADDMADVRRLEHQATVWETTEADLITCRVRSLDSLGEGLERFVAWANDLRKPGDFLRERFVESPVIQPGAFFTKEAYLRAGGYRVEEGPEDYDLWLRMLENGARFFQASEAWLDWRDSEGRLTRSHEDYSEIRMTTTKARYLARMNGIKAKGVMISGSGPIGRRLCKLLLAKGITVHGFFDVAPKKIGGTALGLPIWGLNDFGKIHREATLLGCVGRGGRERVRTLAKKTGYTEGEDFFACC